MSYPIHQKNLVATLFLAILAFGTGCEGMESGDSIDQTTLPIFNGSTVTNGTASINGFVRLTIQKTSGEVYCSGVVMTPNWVLTARHCFENDPELPGVVVPGSTIKITADSVVRTATESSTNVLRHPTADAALVRLNTGYSPAITRFMYPFTDAALLGSTVRCFGYGHNAVTVQPNGKGLLSGSGTLRSGGLTSNLDRRGTSPPGPLPIDGEGEESVSHRDWMGVRFSCRG